MKMTWKWKSLVLAAAVILPMRGSGAAEAAKDQGATDVELPPILAPMVLDNRLDSYAYIVVALTPASGDKVFTIREKVPFLRDGFLREVNKTAIGKTNDPRTVDQVALKTRLLARMNEILPKGTVTDLKFEQIVLTPIQPQS
jgi:hypothetical protein